MKSLKNNEMRNTYGGGWKLDLLVNAARVVGVAALDLWAVYCMGGLEGKSNSWGRAKAGAGGSW